MWRQCHKPPSSVFSTFPLKMSKWAIPPDRFREFPSRVRLGCPRPYNSRHLRLPERFQNSLPPPSTAGDASGLSELVMEFPAVLGVLLSGIKRDKPNGTNGFLQKSAVSCGFLRKSAVSCESLRLRNAVIPRKSENLHKSAKICEKLRIRLGLSNLVCPF